jgi:hypothetical protein
MGGISYNRLKQGGGVKIRGGINIVHYKMVQIVGAKHIVQL